MAEEAGGGFLSRWARRKEQARSGGQAPSEPPAVEIAPVPDAPAAVASSAVASPIAAPEAAAEPLPTMADVALLSRDSDYSRFVASGVDDSVKHAAMKKLFADPHFNVMDGLDTYIDDYGQPDPIPMAMLRQMSQSKFLRLFDDEEEEKKNNDTIAAPANPAAPVSEPANPSDDDPDLRLQQDDAAGRPGPDEGARA